MQKLHCQGVPFCLRTCHSWKECPAKFGTPRTLQKLWHWKSEYRNKMCRAKFQKSGTMCEDVDCLRQEAEDLANKKHIIEKHMLSQWASSQKPTD